MAGNDMLRTIVRGAYDVQKLRIQIGNRLAGNFKQKLGVEPSTSEEDSLDSKGKEILTIIRGDYRILTDGVIKFPRQSNFKGTELISSYTELSLIAQYIELEEIEKQHFSRLGNILKGYPIYTDFLVNVKGIGPAMAGVIISEFDIHKAKYASSLERYAGIDVAPDGKGRSRKTEHLIDIKYKTKDGETKIKKGITFNPFLKTKLIGVLGASFLRAGDNKYRDIYLNYKHRIENMIEHQDKSLGHRHNMAVRYMVKMFLHDLYAVWRDLEGLEVWPPYAEAKLGLTHGVDAPSKKKTTVKKKAAKKKATIKKKTKKK